MILPPDLSTAGILGPVTVDVLMEWGPVVAVLLATLLLLRELMEVVSARKGAIRLLDAMIVPLFIVFVLQIGLIMFGG